MATVKITELPELTGITANGANTVLVAVDLSSGALGTTGKITATNIARTLYTNEILNVGQNPVVFPNVIGQFAGTDPLFLQVNIQNFEPNGSSDLVLTADTGTNTDNYIDLGINNSTFSDPQYSVMSPLDGYLIVNGTDPAYSDGNLVLGTLSPKANVLLAVGGMETDNLTGKFTKTEFNFYKPLDVTGNVKTSSGYVFADDTYQTTAASSAEFTQAAFDQANTVAGDLTTANNWLQANDASTLASAEYYTDTANTSMKSYVDTANTDMKSYVDTANSDMKLYVDENYLANTTGIFDGSLTVTGNVISNYSISINNTNMPANNQYLIITGTNGNVLGTPSNPGYTIHSAIDGNGNRVVAESYGVGSSVYSGFIGRRGRGTAAAPSAVQNGDIITRLGGNAYGSTKFSQFADARIEFVATETHTDASKGTQIQFWTTTSGSNTATQIGTMNGNTVSFTGTVNPQKGFVYTPNNITTNSSTYTIDFQRDSMIRMSVNADTTITLQNYAYGKMVEVWITNSAAQNKTITHGCLANNSTSKLTTFTISAQSCAFLRYFSIDGDQANTFVSIVS